VKSLKLGDLTNPPYNVFTSGEILLIVYDGTQYQIVGTSAGMFYKRPTSNYTIYVNVATGSDTLYDGTSATVGTGTSGPFATIGKGVLTAFNYAPSQFTITIQVASGTYAENVTTPAYAGPNLVINGAGASATTVNAGNNNAITVQGPNTLTCSNLTAQTSLVYPYTCFAALSGATLITQNTSSGNAGAAVFYANGGYVFPQTHTFNGNAFACFWAQNPGFIEVGQYTFTFSTPVAMSEPFVVTGGRRRGQLQFLGGRGLGQRDLCQRRQIFGLAERHREHLRSRHQLSARHGGGIHHPGRSSRLLTEIPRCAFGADQLFSRHRIGTGRRTTTAPIPACAINSSTPTTPAISPSLPAKAGRRRGRGIRQAPRPTPRCRPCF